MELVRGKWLENVDRTHLVLAGGKPGLLKKLSVCQLSLFFKALEFLS